MDDKNVHNKFVRSVGLSISSQGIVFSHDYGEKSFPWQSVTHAFAVVLKRRTVSQSLLFILFPSDEETFFFTDSNTIASRYLKIDDREQDLTSFREMSPSELRKAREEEFRRIVREVCTMASYTYFDRPLRAYLRGNQDFLPVFSTLRDVTDYCCKALSVSGKDEDLGIKSLEKEDEKLTRVATAAKDREEWKEGTVIEGRYTVQEVLKGGMGYVYIAFDAETVRFIAIKTFQDRYLWDEHVVKQFVKEAEIWIKLERHPNIVQAELVKVIEGRPCIFLEYVPGTDMEKLMEREKLSIRRSLELGIQFCHGMSHVFRKLGLIHRDIKPSNCLITKEGNLKITDFGLGKIFDEGPAEGELVAIPRKVRRKKGSSSSSGSSATSSTTVAGTLPFMAPELFTTRSGAGVKTDIYAFGVLLYMALTGKNPFNHDDPMQIIMNHQCMIPDEPCKVNREVPESLSKLVMRCVDKDPRKRPGDFTLLLQELEKIYNELFHLQSSGNISEETLSEEEWINKGRSLASINHHMEAILTFEQALMRNPRSFNAHICRGASLIELGKPRESLSCFNDALKIDSSRWEPWMYRGEAYWKIGSIEEALNCFDRALSLNDQNALIYGLKGKLLAELGKYERALSCYNSALSLDPRADEIWDEKGSVFLTMRNYENALLCFNEALRINPRSCAARYHHGVALYNLGFFSEAVASAEKSLTVDHGFADAYSIIGECYRDTGQTEKALEAFNNALKLKPGELKAFYSCIDLMREKGRWEEALDYVLRALDADPGNVLLCTRHAEILYSMGFYDEALAQCDAVRQSGDSVESIISSIEFWNATVESFFGNIEEKEPPAEKSYSTLNALLADFCNTEEALRYISGRGRHNPAAPCLKACLNFIEGRTEEASRWVDESQNGDLFFDESKALKDALISCSEENKAAASRKKGIIGSLFRKEENESKEAGTLFLEGLQKFRLGLLEESRRNLKEALILDPGLSCCFFYLACSYNEEGRSDEAAACDSRFRASHPDSLYYWKERNRSMPCRSSIEEDIYYMGWVKKAPWDHRAWIACLIHLAGRGFLEECKALSSRLLKDSLRYMSFSSEPSLHWVVRGYLELSLGRNRDALKSFATALEKGSRRNEVGLGMALAYAARRDNEKCLYSLQNMGDGASALAAYIMAGLSMGRQAWDEALETVEKAVEKDPENRLLLFRKAQIYHCSQQYGKLLQFYSEAYVTAGHIVPVRLLRALALLESQKVDDAVLELTSILASDPEHMNTLQILGSIQCRIQQVQKGMATYEKIMGLCNLSSENHRGRGIVYYLAHRYQEAKECFTTALNLNPFDSDAWQFLGALHFYKGCCQESLKCWKNALYCRGRDRKALVNRALLSYHQGNYQEAQEYVVRALCLDPENFFAWMCRARCQWKMGFLDNAQRNVEKALSFSPHSVSGWTFKGIVEFHRKEVEQSFKSFEKALQLDNRKAELYYNRGLCSLLLNNQHEANRSLERSLALNPRLFEALIARFSYEMLFKQDLPAQNYSAIAQKVDPGKFERWALMYQETRSPLMPLDPLDLDDDLFDLPFPSDFAVSEPFEPLCYLLRRIKDI